MITTLHVPLHYQYYYYICSRALIVVACQNLKLVETNSELEHCINHCSLYSLDSEHMQMNGFNRMVSRKIMHYLHQ